MREEWRSVSLECGALCVMMVGVVLMLKLYVTNWDSITQVRERVCSQLICIKYECPQEEYTTLHTYYSSSCYPFVVSCVYVRV